MKKTEKTSHKPKHVKVTHAHHKPYRKRHYALLIASLALGVALINTIVIYSNNEYLAGQVASQTIADVFGGNDEKSTTDKVVSTYGFGLSYDTKRYYASAVDASSGELYVGNELATSRAYNAIRLSDQRVGSQDTGSFKLTYYQGDKPANADLGAMEKTYIVQKQSDPTSMVKQGSEKRTYGGVEFLRSEWSRQTSASGVSLSIQFTTYIAVVNGSPLTVIASHGVSDGQTAEVIMNSFTQSTRTQAIVPMATTVAAKYNQSLTLLDKMFGVSTASAAAPSYTTAERISATYGASVVKIYNIVAGDLAIDGRVVLKDQLDGGMGSGFIINGEGVIATNGHVAVIGARDAIVTYALEALSKGNNVPITELIRMSGTTQADVAGAANGTEVLKIVLKKLYDLPEDRFSFVNAKQNMLVGLGEEQVDVKKLLEMTAKKQSYPAEDTIKEASLVRADYGGTILPQVTGEYTQSDVAIVKIKGSGYPMVQLGDISTVSQGSNLNIMGFPGIASGNGIVSETKTAATLTTGKVSSKKKDTGNHNLIETDTEIGHGNSGGPAFDDEGNVVGIATYAVDPGGAGDGTLNYVRDVDDLKKIADKESIDLTINDTQKIWNQAIQQFYTARYKKAVANFNKVKELYPEHPRVAELTAIAEKRIANGENIDDFPVVPVIIVTVVVIMGVGLSVFFIVRHKHGHNAMVQGVVAGQVQPMMPGAPAQMIPAATPPAQLFGQPAVPPAQPAPFGPAPATSMGQPNPPMPVEPNPFEQSPSPSVPNPPAGTPPAQGNQGQQPPM